MTNVLSFSDHLSQLVSFLARETKNANGSLIPNSVFGWTFVYFEIFCSQLADVQLARILAKLIRPPDSERG